MKESFLEVDYSELKDRVLPMLRGRVFHVTSRARFDQIVTSGLLKSNADGSLGNTYPQSAVSLGRRNRYVCLFDLRDQSEEDIQWGLDCFYFLAPAPLGDDVVFFLLDPLHYPKLVLWEDIKSDVPIGEFHIPRVECWYAESIPLIEFSEAVHVTVRRPPIAPDSLLAAIIAANEHRNR